MTKMDTNIDNKSTVIDIEKKNFDGGAAVVLEITPDMNGKIPAECFNVPQMQCETINARKKSIRRNSRGDDDDDDERMNPIWDLIRKIFAVICWMGVFAIFLKIWIIMGKWAIS